MPQTHPPYAPEYQRRISSRHARGARFRSWRASSSRRPTRTANESGTPDSMKVCASDWLRATSSIGCGVRTGCRAESAILSKAAAWFATETGATLHRGSNS